MLLTHIRKRRSSAPDDTWKIHGNQDKRECRTGSIRMPLGVMNAKTAFVLLTPAGCIIGRSTRGVGPTSKRQNLKTSCAGELDLRIFLVHHVETMGWMKNADLLECSNVLVRVATTWREILCSPHHEGRLHFALVFFMSLFVLRMYQ